MSFRLLRKNKEKSLEKRFTTFTEQLSNIFGRIKNDITTTNSRVESAEKEIDRLRQWIDYLNSQNRTISEQNDHLRKKYAEISEKSFILEKNHVNISYRTEEAHKILNRHEEALKSHKNEVVDLLDSQKAELRRAISNHQDFTKEEVERLKAWINYFLATLDKQKSRESSLEADIDALRKSFSEMTLSSKNTINTLRNENLALKTQLEAFSEALDNLKSELSETRNTLKNTQESLTFLKNSKESESSTLEKSSSIQEITSQNPTIQAPTRLIVPNSDFEKHIIQRVMPNRKGYILHFIMDLVSENRYSTKEIEEIVVKEKRLCGRTSFYAYLKELKFRGKVGYATVDERTILVNTEKNTQKTLYDLKSEN